VTEPRQSGSPDRPAEPDPADRDPFRDVHYRTLGMWLFLISLSALFAATMIGYLIFAIVRFGEAPDLPGLPGVLAISTVVILVSSGTLQWARASIRRDRTRGLKVGVVLTLLLGLVFLALQTVAWFDWIDRAVSEFEADDYRFAAAAFLVLSGVHAVHVIGGLIPMIVVLIRSFLGHYSAADYHGVNNLAMYWHFLDVVWIIMYVALLIFT